MVNKTLTNTFGNLPQHHDSQQQIKVVPADLSEPSDTVQPEISTDIFSSAIATENIITSLLNFVFANIFQELKINWLFIRRDLTMSIVPGVLFTISALVNYPPNSLTHGISLLASSFIYFWLCITSFCISNQLADVEEDKLNKPDRPLAQGIISYQGAQIRLYVVMALFTAVAWWLGVLQWSLVWQAGFIVHNHLGGAKHWMSKNILSGFGIMSEIGAAWQIVAPISPIVWSWILVLGSACITLISVQDFRDIPGDKAIGRNTFPIVVGEFPSRILLSIGFVIFPIIIHFSLMTPTTSIITVALWDVTLLTLSCILATRVLLLRSYQADHRTYLLFTGWFCLLLTSSIFTLRV